MTENIILSPVTDLSDLSSSAAWSVRYLDPSGYECLLSLESTSGVVVLNKAQAAITRLTETGCIPLNHHQVINAKEEAAKEEAHLCPVHNVPMHEWKKIGRTWYSHKLENGSWCKGGKS